MRYIKSLNCCLLLLFFSLTATGKETIVMVRHGEKPKSDLGQLSCQGLNRSLLLPAYFQKNFPKPDYIFAPNPSVQNAGFSYVRPLATIEPTAIHWAMPVSTQIGYNQDHHLVNTLLDRQYHNAVLYVAWEHSNIMTIAKLLLRHFHNKTKVPFWSDHNYNRVLVFVIDWSKHSIQFRMTSEGMSHLSQVCQR